MKSAWTLLLERHLVAFETGARSVRRKGAAAECPADYSIAETDLWALARGLSFQNKRQLYTQLRERRLHLAIARGTHTAAEWQDLCARHHHCCARCSTPGLPLFKDHIRPISKGGSDSIDNLQPLCKRCNSVKGDREQRFRAETGPRVKPTRRQRAAHPARPELANRATISDEREPNLYWRKGHPVVRFKIGDKTVWLALGQCQPSRARHATQFLRRRVDWWRELERGGHTPSQDPADWLQQWVAMA